LLINIVESVEAQQLLKILNEIEDMQGVEYVDAVSGEHDLVVTVETQKSIDVLVARLHAKPWLRNVSVLRMISVFEREEPLHRSSM